ncbi:MAG: hypothetical protein BGO37_09915 [Cellulomonas sp. 73-92]|nr:MAG: hypothetical protein BGO37_09915 [Cellulomonas sp. 73-92]
MVMTKLVRRVAAAAGVAAVAVASAGAAWVAGGNGDKGPSPTASSSVSVDDQALRAQKMADLQKPRPAESARPSGGILADERAAGLVASSLGVSHDAAEAALTQLIPLSGAKGGLDPHGDGFRAVATGLGVTPERLAQAIDDLKRGLG